MNDETKLKPGWYLPTWLGWLLIILLFCWGTLATTLWVLTRIDLEGSNYDCFKEHNAILVENDLYERIFDNNKHHEIIISQIATAHAEISSNYAKTFEANSILGAGGTNQDVLDYFSSIKPEIEEIEEEAE